MNEPKPTNTEVSCISGDSSAAERRRSARLKVTAIAAVSALTGGLAAAWFYRRTLTRLQHAELNGRDSNFGMSDEPDDDGV